MSNKEQDVPQATASEMNDFLSEIEIISMLESAARGQKNTFSQAVDISSCRVEDSSAGYTQKEAWLEKALYINSQNNEPCPLFAAYRVKKTPTYERFESSTGLSLFDKAAAKTLGITSFYSRWGTENASNRNIHGSGFWLSQKYGTVSFDLRAEGEVINDKIKASKLEMIFRYSKFKVKLEANTQRRPIFKRGNENITEQEFRAFIANLGMITENIIL